MPSWSDHGVCGRPWAMVVADAVSRHVWTIREENFPRKNYEKVRYLKTGRLLSRLSRRSRISEHNLGCDGRLRSRHARASHSPPCETSLAGSRQECESSRLVWMGG